MASRNTSLRGHTGTTDGRHVRFVKVERIDKGSIHNQPQLKHPLDVRVGGRETSRAGGAGRIRACDFRVMSPAYASPRGEPYPTTVQRVV